MELNQYDCIIITGAFGFLGKNFIKKFQDVITKPIYLLKPRTPKNELDFEQYPNLSESEICELVSQKDCALLHFATDYGYSHDDARTVETNLLLPLKILQFMKSSSLFVNTDTVLPKWLNSYSLSKKQFNEWIRIYSNRIKYLNLSIEHFFGPSDDKTKFVPNLLNMMIERTDEILLTPGNQKRDFLYINDVLSAFDLIFSQLDSIFSNERNDIIISYGHPISIREFVELAADVLNYDKSRLKFGYYPYRENEIMDLHLDISFLNELGWKPKIDRKKSIYLYAKSKSI